MKIDSEKVKEYFRDSGRANFQELIADIADETDMLVSKELEQQPSLDELGVTWGDEEFPEDLGSFVNKYTEKLLDRVILVIESFEKEAKEEREK